MPTRSQPTGLTPRALSARKPPGIRPSPQALSTAPSRGSSTTTDKLPRTAYMAAARPTGPPPTTTTSLAPLIATSLASSQRSSIPSDSGQCLLFDLDPPSEHSCVEDGKSNSCEPSRVHEWQGRAFEHHSHVVGMAQYSIGAAADQWQSRHHNDAGVPLPSERGDAPPAKALRGNDYGQRCPPESRQEGAL